jgi:hypothetical protein
MSENLNISENEDVADELNLERKHGAIRTGLFLLAFSQVIPVAHYLWQVYCC